MHTFQVQSGEATHEPMLMVMQGKQERGKLEIPKFKMQKSFENPCGC
jgi:hypothetical protein